MKEICDSCKKREATLNWVGEGGMIDFTHGNYARWCEYCATKAQLKKAKENAKKIPYLEKQLIKLK